MNNGYQNDSYQNNERVFIVGLPRTGSTLLRSILNKSERVQHYLRNAFPAPVEPPGQQAADQPVRKPERDSQRRCLLRRYL